jgi:tryptophanyl-tRNA synthetase
MMEKNMSMDQKKKIEQPRSAIAGFQPTGDGRLHVGNLLGSALPFAAHLASGSKFAMVADVHALSMGRLPEGFAAAKARMLRELVACGLADGGALLFEQSMVPEILALQALLSPFAPIGDLRRMTQFEQKSKSSDGDPLALLAYPCLMAADILALGALDAVVGEDQRQHLELARAISMRLSRSLGVDLGEPRAVELTAAARVKSLRDPSSKMSKSDADGAGAIFLSDTREQLAKKIKRAVTDTQALPQKGAELERELRPGAANLVDMCARAMGVSEHEVLARVAGCGHSALKELAIESLDAMLAPIRLRLEQTSVEQAKAIARESARAAREVAARNLERVIQALG